MTAETLRRAAALMRERAEAANLTAPSPWLADGAEITTDDQEPIEPLCVVTSGMHWQEAHSIRMHVASWHPAVALAVAKVMDDVALAWEICDDGWTRDMDGDAIRFEDTVDGGWLTVARTYLGEAS